MRQKTRLKRAIDPEQWMKDRWELFLKYTVPSVQKQTCKNFEWLIVFDPATPTKYTMEAKIYGTILLHKNFRVACQTHISTGGIVITSRMDNDDSLHKDYISNIHEWYRRKGKTGVLTYPVGWIFKPHKNKLFHVRYMKNQFLTLVEKADKKVRTILFTRHTRAIEYFKLHRLEYGHRWCTIVHENNLANRGFGVKVPPHKLNKGEFWE